MADMHISRNVGNVLDKTYLRINVTLSGTPAHEDYQALTDAIETIAAVVQKQIDEPSDDR